MKTDLARILSVSGQHGLFRYLAQQRGGAAIVEALSTGKRTAFDLRTKMTTLEDISIYTQEGELKLKEVFRAIQGVLGDKDAPSPKATGDELKALFSKAVPTYDGDRFYVSHMKKVVEWYNELKQFASLDFEEEGDAEEAKAEEAKVQGGAEA